MPNPLSSLRIRTRIALTIIAVCSVLLLTLCVGVYFAFRSALYEELDDTLRLRAAANLQLVDASVSPPRLNAGADPGGDRAEGDATLRLYDRGGTLLDDASPATPRSAREQDAVQNVALSGADTYVTVRGDESGPIRIIAIPVKRRPGVTVGVLVTGVERSQVDETLNTLRLILLVAAPVTTFLVGLAAFWIARNALRPVSVIARTAREISAVDLTRRIEGGLARDELGELAETLNDMIARLADTVERERRFTADASHELRTPLAAIETSVEVTLSRTRTPDEYRHSLESVRVQARRLTNLTRQLLLLSRLDGSGVQSRFETIDLGEAMEAIVAAFVETHPGARLSLHSESRPALVSGDLELIARAVQNILDNAVTHGGPAVPVTLGLSSTNGRVMLTVSDDGPGVPPELRDHLFERFRLGDDSRSVGGTGLGLAIVEAIIRVHNGEIRLAEPTPGVGATFVITLPAADA